MKYIKNNNMEKIKNFFKEYWIIILLSIIFVTISYVMSSSGLPYVYSDLITVIIFIFLVGILFKK